MEDEGFKVTPDRFEIIDSTLEQLNHGRGKAADAVWASSTFKN